MWINIIKLLRNGTLFDIYLLDIPKVVLKNKKPYQRDFSGEWEFVTSRSSGPGGQHVNKVNTRVTLRFDVDGSQLLSEEEKDTLKKKLSNKISNDNILIISSESARSQLKNKEACIYKFYQLLKLTFSVKKKRKPTKPSKAAVEKRLQNKQKQSEKKKLRRYSLGHSA